jgi:thiol-disulfide isomerase/thioredoxin
LSEILIPSQEAFSGLVDGTVTNGGRVLALFTAPTWCIPCRQFESHWNKAQEVVVSAGLPIVFAKVDMGESPEDTGQHWATARFGIRGVPTVKLFNAHGIHDIKSRAVIPFLKEVETYDG